MSGKIFECGYGAIVNEDVEVLESCLKELIPAGVVRVLEIGAHDGATALGIKRFVEAAGAKLVYYGIEPDPHRRQFAWEGATLINGKSSEVFNQIPEVDLVWVDGCHCFTCVALDILLYSPKVRNFGFMCFHDVNPTIQGKEKQYHGPDHPAFYVDVLNGIKAMNFPSGAWEFYAEKCPTDIPGCGTRAYRKGRL